MPKARQHSTQTILRPPSMPYYSMYQPEVPQNFLLVCRMGLPAAPLRASPFDTLKSREARLRAEGSNSGYDIIRRKQKGAITYLYVKYNQSHHMGPRWSNHRQRRRTPSRLATPRP